MTSDEDGNRHDTAFYSDCPVFYNVIGGVPVDPTRYQNGRYPMVLPEDPLWYTNPPPDNFIFLTNSSGITTINDRKYEFCVFWFVFQAKLSDILAIYLISKSTNDFNKPKSTKLVSN